MDIDVKEIIEIAHDLYNRQLVSGKAGNISVRVKIEDKDIIAISPTLKSLKDLKEEEIVLVNLDGEILTKGKPSSEINLHLEIYKARNDVNAIVHTHSPYATGFAFSSKKIKRLEGFGKITTPFLEEIDYLPPGSVELAENAAKAIGDEDVLILKHHGVLCVADELKEAANLAEFIEDSAKTQFITHTLSLTEDI